MVDLYNRKAKLEYWIQRVNTDLSGTDKSDLLILIEHMQDKERASLWIIRCITALISIRRQLGRSFQEVTKDDIRSFLKWMEQRNYKPSTNEKFRQILKLFFKVVYGNGETYPEQVNFFSTRVGKDKRFSSPELDTREYLEEDEIVKLIQSTPTIQKKAFVACMYESGARPEEFLRLTNNDFIIDTNGIIVILRGKTGERRVRIISYAPLFQQWLEIHPLKNQSTFNIWISESTNYKNKPLGLRGAEKIIEKTLPAVLPNKHARLYILRHSRATHLSKHLTEAQMWTFFGWQPGTQVVRHYIHLSGKDIDGTLLSLSKEGNKVVKLEDYKIKPIECIRCFDSIPPGNKFCGRCGLKLDFFNQYTVEKNLEEENKVLELKLDTFRQEIDGKLKRLMLWIQQNPKLALLDPKVLLEKME